MDRKLVFVLFSDVTINEEQVKEKKYILVYLVYHVISRLWQMCLTSVAAVGGAYGFLQITAQFALSRRRG